MTCVYQMFRPLLDIGSYGVAGSCHVAACWRSFEEKMRWPSDTPYIQKTRPEIASADAIRRAAEPAKCGSLDW
jgi:hypothetical protein